MWGRDREGGKLRSFGADRLYDTIEIRQQLTMHPRLALHSVTSIFTAAVIFFQLAISSASQALASSTDFDGTMLKFCLVKASLVAGVCSASMVALCSTSSTGLGVAAGANIAFQAIVPTSGKPTSAIVGTSG